MLFNKKESNNADSSEYDVNSFGNDINKEDALPDHPDIPKDLAFLPPAISSGIVQSMPNDALNQLSGRNDDFGRLSRHIIRGANIMARVATGDVNAAVEGIQYAAETASEVRSQAARTGVNPSIRVVDPTPPSNIGGSGRGSGMNGGSGSPDEHHHLLDRSPDPTHTNFTTDIRQLYFTPKIQQAEIGFAAPAFMVHINVQIPTAASDLGSYVQSAIFSELRNVCAKNVNYSVSNVPNFTTTNIVNYMNNLFEGLGTYYCIKRYLMWLSRATNKNEALYYMATTLTPTQFNSWKQLERKLEGFSIPPRVNDLMYWLFSIYASGDKLPGSPICMLDTVGLNAGVPDYGIALSYALSTSCLGANYMEDVSNVFSAAIPSWDEPVLWNGTANIEYDEQWLTLFRNTPFLMSGSNPSTHSVQGPTIVNSSSTIRYNTLTNALDGAIPGFVSATTSSTLGDGFIPTLILPVTSTTLSSGNNTNRMFYGQIGSVKGWYDCYVDDLPLVAADFTYTPQFRFGNLANTGLVAGSQRLFQVTAESAVEASRNVIDYLMSWESMPKKTNKNLSAKRRPRSRYSKK